MMHAQALEKLVKKPVKDTYGRNLGQVIGFSLDSSGNMKGLGVDHGTGQFIEYPRERIIIDGSSETIILLPEWQEDVDKLKKNTQIAKKRTKVLEKLRSEGEIPDHAFVDLKSSYEDEINTLKASCSTIVDKLEIRINNIESSRIKTEKFLSTLKVQFHSDEIDGETFKRASQSTMDMMEKDTIERHEISNILTWLSVSDQKESEHDPEPIAVPEPEPIAVPEPEPIAVPEPESSSIPEPIPQPEPETNYNPDLGLLMNQNQIIENGPETIPEDKEVHPTIVPNDPELEPESHPFIINERPHAANIDVESVSDNPSNDFQLFEESDSKDTTDSFITKITDFANKHPDLSPIEDGSIPTNPNTEQKSMPKSERTDNGWKISFE